MPTIFSLKIINWLILCVSFLYSTLQSPTHWSKIPHHFEESWLWYC